MITGENSVRPVGVADPGCDGERIYVARIAQPGSDIGGGGQPASDSARITPAGSDIDGGSQLSGVARNTPAGSGIGGGGQPASDSARITLPLYKEAPTNPLPSNNGFIAAPGTANLQHGHVNPLPKETLHHG